MALDDSNDANNDDPWFRGSVVVSTFAYILGIGVVCVLLVSVMILRFFPFDVCESEGIPSTGESDVGTLEYRLSAFAADGTPSISRSSSYVGVRGLRISLLTLVGGVLILAAEVLRQKPPAWSRLIAVALFLGLLPAVPYLVLPARPTMVYLECLFPDGLSQSQQAEVLGRIQKEVEAHGQHDPLLRDWRNAALGPVSRATGHNAPGGAGVALRVLYPPDSNEGPGSMAELADRMHLAFREAFLGALEEGRSLPVEVPSGGDRKPVP
jgi:hypothetical protein